MRLSTLFLFAILLFINACSSIRQVAEPSNVVAFEHNCFNTETLTHDDLALADSLLYNSLNNTGLHTFISDLKPMSDVISFRWAIEPTEEDENPALNYIVEYEQFNRIAAALSCGPLRAVITPFRVIFDGERYVQLRIVRTDAIERILAEYPEFWSRWAFASGSDPAVIIQVMEYEDRYDRFRGYGYLYGYPAYAVDFFVEAAKSQSDTGEFVERDFMQMPVVSGRTGQFVYAVPKGHEKNEIDKEIERRASENVATFNSISSNFYREDGSFDSFGFLREFYLENVLTR